MPFPITPFVHVRRDDQGRVRQLEHSEQPYALAEAARRAAGPESASLKLIADAYLQEVAPLFEIPAAELAGMSERAEAAPVARGRELRFKEQKAQGQVGVVAYDQTVFGLPAHESGVSVIVDAARQTVIGSSNQLDYDLDPPAPDPAAPYVPGKIDAGVLVRLLGGGEPHINAQRLLIYRYLAAERLDPQRVAHDRPEEFTGFAGKDSSPFPTRAGLPPVDERIVERQTYIVTDVLFTMADDRGAVLNWRCYVETQTGSVLYLRPLVACVSGFHFNGDPVTSSGRALSAASPPAELDAERVGIDLQHLSAPEDGTQSLAGVFFALRDLESRAVAMPTAQAPLAFDFPSNTDNFAACCAYHNCQSVFDFIAGVGVDLGTYFDGTTLPVPVDPHALGGEVNAQARGNAFGSGLGSLVFGRASAAQRMGIAADARVVWHEFGHALLWDHVGSPNFGFSHSAGDSLGAMLFDPASKLRGQPLRFETFPFMANSSGLSRRHDRAVGDGWAWGGRFDDTQYGSEQILSTTLFRIYRLAGGDEEDSLAERQWAARYLAAIVIKAIALLARTSRDPRVYVDALIQTDATHGVFEGHPGGAFRKIFRWSFEQQGLYQNAATPRPIAAPGEPPTVDVFIHNGTPDESGAVQPRLGGYAPFLRDFRGRPEVWNRQAADGGAADQPAVPGQVNFAYVRVGNRGRESATEVTVRGFQQTVEAPQNWPTDWRALESSPLAGTASLAPGENAIVGPIHWTPVAETTELLFAVEAAGDSANLSTITAGPILNRRLLRLDNNLAQRIFRALPAESAPSPENSTTTTMPKIESVTFKASLTETTAAPVPTVVLPGDSGKGSAEPSRSLQQIVVKGKQPLPARRPQLESIISIVDQRVRILDTELLPWRMLCRLRIQSKAGEFVGTGWFAGPKTIVTAGHCVFASQMAGDATSITVIPGQNAGALPDQPFGAKTSTKFSTTVRWRSDEDPDFDIGCIHLTETFDPHPGVFSTAVMAKDQLRGFLVNIAGYPADKGGDKLFHHANQVLAVTDRRLFYAIDTMGGQSGAPVWLHETEDGPPLVVGIHAYSEFATPSELGIRANSAPYINADVLELIKGWVYADNAG